MNRVLPGLAALALLGACAFGAAPTGIPWAPSFDEAVKKAAASQKLVMVDFHTDG